MISFVHGVPGEYRLGLPSRLPFSLSSLLFHEGGRDHSYVSYDLARGNQRAAFFFRRRAIWAAALHLNSLVRGRNSRHKAAKTADFLGGRTFQTEFGLSCAVRSPGDRDYAHRGDSVSRDVCMVAAAHASPDSPRQNASPKALQRNTGLISP